MPGDSVHLSVGDVYDLQRTPITTVTAGTRCYKVSENTGVVVLSTGGTATVGFDVSNDGDIWADSGVTPLALTAGVARSAVVSGAFKFLRLNVTAISGGSVTAKAGA